MQTHFLFVSKTLIISLFCLYFFFFSTSHSLEASLFNPFLAKDHPGFTAFLEGKTYFDAEKWEKAIYYFKQAIQESKKPIFECEYFYFIGDETECSACMDSWFDSGDEDDLDEEDDCEYNYFLINRQGIFNETYYSLYRHSHFYLGLIFLQQTKIKTAHFHFMKAIGFGGQEELIGPVYFRCIHYLNPAWIMQASLTSLSLGKVDLAAQLSEFALKTNQFIEESINSDGVLDFNWWDRNQLGEYWSDLRNSKMDRKWQTVQEILIYNVKSLVAQEQGNLTQAIEWISSAIRIKDARIKHYLLEESPEHAVLYSNRGMFYLEAKDYSNALTDFKKAVELDPFFARNYANRGFVYLVLKKYDQAIQDYNQALELNPSCLEFYRQRALCHLCQHSLELASTDLLTVTSIENHKRDQYNETGLDFFGKGEFQRSIEAFDHFIQANPTESIGYQNRGAAYYQLDSIDLAIDDFNHALQLAPQNDELYVMRGVSYLWISHFEQAQADLLTALELNPEQVSIYKNLAAFYYSINDFDKSVHYCLQALSYESSKNDPELFRNLAIIYFLQQNYQDALVYCNELLTLGEATTTIYLIQGLCFFENHQFEEAIKSYDLAIASDSSFSQAYFNRGQAHYCLLDLDKAWTDFNHAIELDPDNPSLYKSRGLALLHLQRSEDAYQDFFTAIQLVHKKELEEDQKHLFLSYHSIHPTPTHMSLTYPNQSYCSMFSPASIPLFPDYLQLLGPQAFHQGLIIGITEGGITGLKELGPFLAQLLFHPVDTAKELFESMTLLMDYIAKEEWGKVCECLAPELKELYLTWDEIEDYQKGVLAGRFIGKNGVGLLVGMGVMKSSMTLKKAYLSNKTKMFFGLRKSPPKRPTALLPLPFSLKPGSPKNNWALAVNGGVIIEKKYEMEQTLAYLLPKKNAQTQIMLEKRVVDKVCEKGVPVKTWEDVEKWAETTNQANKFQTNPRELPLMVLEAEIVNPTSTGLEVVLNEEGQLLSALPITEFKEKISVIGINKKIHIMQPKHAWDKLIKLTGHLEED